jgi:two-component system response regulator FixJ
MTPSFLIGVVDDDQDVRTSLADLLRAGGYRAACFGTAEEFLESPDRDECACVFADISMPGMSGIDLLERFAPTLAHRPVIVMTGQAEDVWRARALQAGAVAFIHKPFQPKSLLALLAESVPEAQSETSVREDGEL